MARHRKVRFSYPEALVQLAIEVSQKYGKRAAAKALGLPLSTVYRWSARCGHVFDGYAGTDCDNKDRRQRDLVENCEAHGFTVRRSLSLLDPTWGISGESDTSTMFLHVDHSRGEAKSSRERMTIHPASVAKPVVPSSARDSNGMKCITWDVSERTRKHVEQARKTIEQRYYSSLSCDELSGKAGISKWHFIKSFRSIFGISPYRYLMQVRVQQAKKLLYTSDQPLDSIAIATGFDTLSSLCRGFKSVEGTSLSSLIRGIRMGYVPRVHLAVDQRTYISTRRP